MSDAESDSLEDALGNMSQLIRKRVEKLEEREEAFKRMKRTFEEENPSLGKTSDVLRLNVGGTRIDVLRRTLTSVEGSMLSSRFSGRWDESLEKDADGNFFIDQPIELFLPMINYLRAQACMTPRAHPVLSPQFLKDSQGRANFFRMLEYYGMTLGVYPYGIIEVDKIMNDSSTGHPDYKVEAGQWTTFDLSEMPGNNVTSVKSYEVILGKSTSAQIGWTGISTAKSAEKDEKGVGYVDGSIALDCSRSGIAVGAISSGSSKTLASFVSIAGLPSIGEGTVIRCENKSRKWFANGTLVASSSSSDGVSQISGVSKLGSLYPCFSVKGSLRVSNIELEY